MKYIRLFLASSIDEFSAQRRELGDYIRSLNDIFVKRGIYLQLTLCEDVSNAVAPERKQEEYNQQIRDSQYFYIILGKHAGMYTIEEFDVALEQFRKKSTPKLYTYFRKFPEGELPEQEILDFMDRLDRMVGHYYSFFAHLDSIKLNMLLELTRDAQSGIQPKFQDGQAFLDNKPVLSLERIPVYSKNEAVQQMKAELLQLNQAFAETAVRFGRDPSDTEAGRLLAEYGEKRVRLSDQLHSLEMDILNLCQTVACLNNREKPLTWREQEAIRQVEAGNYDGALNILRDAMREKELSDAEEVARTGLERIQNYLSEEKLRIDTLKAKGIHTGTLPEITQCYEKAVGLARKYHIRPELLLEYSQFLYDQRSSDRGIEVVETLLHWYESDGSDEKKAELLNQMGLFFMIRGEFGKAGSSFREAAEVSRMQSAQAMAEGRIEDMERNSMNKHTSEANLAGALCLQCLLDPESVSDSGMHHSPGKSRTADDLLTEAEILYRESLLFFQRRNLENLQDPECCEKIVQTSGGLAKLLVIKGELEEAEDTFRKLLEMYRSLAKEYPVFEEKVAAACRDLAELLNKKQCPQEAEPLFREALERYRRLAQENPARYEMEETGVIAELADLNALAGRRSEARELYQEGLEVCRRLEGFGKFPEMLETELLQRLNALEALEANADNIITLNDANGNEVPMEFLDLIEYKGESYAVLFPVDDPDDSGEVVILRVDDSDPDSDEESYYSVEDDETLAALFDIFKERFKDVFQFEC